MKHFYREYIRPRRQILFTGLLVLLTALRFFLFLQTPLAGMALEDSEDWNLLWHAWNLEQGGWLGAYNEYTLSLGIAFPFFVLLCRKLCIPFMLGTALLYTGSILVFLRAFKPLFPSRKVRGFLYLFLLYSPVMLTASTAQRAWDLTLVPSLILLMLSLGMGLYRRRNENFILWSAGLGLVFAFFWFLRRDNWWVLPFLLLFLGATGLSVLRSRAPKAGLRAACLLLPLVITLAGGLGISLLNLHYYDTFRAFETADTDEETAAQAPSPGQLLKDTAYVALNLSTSQTAWIDTYTGQGETDQLRFLESMTGSQVIYPNPEPLSIRGWAFPTDDRDFLEVAVTDENDQAVAYAEYENSEDVFVEYPEYASSRVCRFTITAPVTTLDGYSLTIYLNGEIADQYPLAYQAVEGDDYYLFLEDVGIYQDPVQFSSQRAAVFSQRALFLYKILSIPLTALAAAGYLLLLVLNISGRSRQKGQLLFLTGTGLTALLGIFLSCLRYVPAGKNPADYCQGPWMLIQIFILCSICWALRNIPGKRKRARLH